MVLALFPGAASAVDLLGGKGSSGTSAATAAAQAATQAAQGQAQSVAKDAMDSLSRAAKAIQDARSAQDAARGIAVTAPTTVTDGLSPNGLVVDPRVGTSTGTNLWVNAGAPTPTTGTDGHVTVTIEQQAQRAILTWQQFNVGKNTTVHFDQSAGNSSTGNSWMALNRIDATGKPSQILGSIKAEGSVVLINPNGVIFNGTSQINVHSLIAAAMDLNSFTGSANGAFKASGPAYVPIIVNGLQHTANGTTILAPSDEANANKVFLNNGLFVNGGFQTFQTNQYGLQVTSGPSAVFSAGLIPGQSSAGITVQAGASIATDVSGFDNGGYVALLGPQVTNAGSITTSAGQITLSAGQNVQIGEPLSGSTQTTYAVRNVFGGLLYSPPAVTGGSAAVNDVNGLLISKRGNITILGDTVEQLGLAEATTSITRAGSLTIGNYGYSSSNPLVFGTGSVTTILPEENGETIPSDAASLANFVAPRIDVTGGGYIDFKSGSLVYAPSAKMTVTGPGQGTQPDGSPSPPAGRVLMEAGSVIDLSGLTTTRSVADYLYTFKVTANDVADTPLAKNLIGQKVTIDLSQTGTRADGETWVGSPLFASSGAGYLANITQGIDQLLTGGGSLSFGSGFALTNGAVSAAFVDVLQAPGAVVNVSGGSIAYTGAHISTTKLIATDGRVMDIGSADPFITYSSLAGSTAVSHPQWGVTEIFTNHLYAEGYDKGGYTNGISAGGVTVTAVNPILEGDIVGNITIGVHQRQLAQAGTGSGGAQLTPDQLPTGAFLNINFAASGEGTRDSVVLQDTTPTLLGNDFTLTSSLSLPSAGTNLLGYNVPLLALSTKRLSDENLGSITISGADSISVAGDVNLAVRAGGSITLNNVTNLDGTLTAHGGSITVSGASVNSLAAFLNGTGQDPQLPPLVLGSHALLDVSGQWINDTGHSTDDFSGALYINGGSVSLSTAIQSKVLTWDKTNRVVTAEDKSPSLILAKGSVIDASSGGYVGTNGRLKYGSDGLPVGKGGNVSLATYKGTWKGTTAVDPNYFTYTDVAYAPTVANHGNVIMDGTIYAGGLSQGGTFSLQVPTVVIDGQATKVTSITTGDQAGTVVLPPSFFADSGFGSFKLTSTYGSTTVTAGTTVSLQQKNYLASSIASLPTTGARLRDFATLGLAPDGMRHAANLALSQVGWAYGAAGDASSTAKLLIDKGARIAADPLANISLTSGGPVVVLGGITAHGGSITITGNSTITGQGNTVATTDALPQYLWIGEDAVLDVSGTFVPNPLVTTYSTGTALAGGSISLATNGAIIAQSGSLFDISGASGTVEVANAVTGLGSSPYATRSVWSNGGSLTLSNPSSVTDAGSSQSSYFAGTINAAGGDARAAGGTLNLTNAILITQSGDVSAPFASGPATTRTQLSGLLPARQTSFITADTINVSGIDTLSLGGALYFSGNVDLKVAGSILLDTSAAATTLLPAGVINTAYTPNACTPAGACIPSIGATHATLEAGYIRATNSVGLGSLYLSLATLADGTLTLKAREQIDLVGFPAFNNAGTVNLISGGDIRLVGTANLGTPPTGGTGVGVISDGYGGKPWAGALVVADNLNLTAREIYPTTDTAYLLMSLGLAPSSASGTHNSITMASNGKTPVAPLSAGGAILVDAKKIVQGGALYAPLGTIQLGFGAGQTLPSFFISTATKDPYNPVQSVGSVYGSRVTTVATDSVTLASGSVTSVSAKGLLIPYGTTTDSTDWTDNNTLLNGPPAKLLVLGGSKVDTQAGAVIDGSGGGDIYATEFVPGTGGSRNVLTTTSQTVYALVPGYASSLAAYDPSFTTSVAAGTTVTLPGGNGIPAGTYTLLPAEYATLPGAYRVAVVSTNANPYAQSITTADGSIYTTGVLGNAINGSSSSQVAMLQIQSQKTWTQYSEIDIAKGNSYFATLAATNGTAVPRLAQDAARFVVTAGASLALNAENLFNPAAGGLGGQLDITGSNIVVAASDQLPSFGTASGGIFTPSANYAGYLFLDADMLSKLGIESTLIGGYRTSTTEGTLISATALNLEIATDAAHPLTGPEVLFTSLAPTNANSSVHGLVVDAGSVITAKGTVSGNSSTALVFGVDPVAQYSADTLTGYSAGVSGDGSLLRVSNGGLVNVIRHFVPGVYQAPPTTPAPTPPVSAIARGNLAIGANVSLAGNTLTLDSSGSTTLASSANLTARNYDLSGSIINVGGGSGGLVVTTDLIGKFAGADAVRLRSASVFNLYGSNTFGDTSKRIGTLTFDGSGFYGDGGATSIVAGNVIFANSQSTAKTTGANLSGAGGSLTLDATGVVTFGAGAKTFSGFASVAATAGSEMQFAGSGSLDARDATVTLTAPRIIAEKASAQSLTTTGLLRFAQGPGTAPKLDPTIIGGSLSFKAGAIADSGTLIAQGGKLSLEATTGDIVLSDNALVSATGTRVVLNDLIQDTPGGAIRFVADNGNVTLDAGTTVDVSGAGRGYAGSLTIAAKGTATLDGMLNGSAQYDDVGGEFSLTAGRFANHLPLGAGFTRSFQVSLDEGDISIANGETLTSENVLLVANHGDVSVYGTIDASSASGGNIGLYGSGTSTNAAGTPAATGVTIGSSAKLIARYKAPDKNSPAYGNGESKLVQRGGTITLGTTGTPDGTLNATYGYENVPKSGAITVASGAIFDVSGGPGGTNIDNTGGSVNVRAPILSDGSVNVSFKGTVATNAKPDGTPSGQGLVNNAYAVWSTADASTDAKKHFDGLVDPQGLYTSSGAQVLAGTWSGPKILSLTSGGTGYTSAPTISFQGSGWSSVTATAIMGVETGYAVPTGASAGSGFKPGDYFCSGTTCNQYNSSFTAIVATVTFNIAGSGSGAVVNAIGVNNAGKVSYVWITAQGSGYSAAPVIAVSGAAGTTQAVVSRNLSVVGISVSSPAGSTPFNTTPTGVTFSGGGGSGALVSTTATVATSLTAQTTLDGAFSAQGAGIVLPGTGLFTATAFNDVHINFYQSTLKTFVNTPFDTAALGLDFAGAQLTTGGTATALPSSMLHLRPEVDLVNPSTSVNGGNITVKSAWNLGAGSVDGAGKVTLSYRTSSGREAGTLALRAINNVAINATISDGFFGTSAPSVATTYSSMNLMTAAVSGKGSFSYDFVGGAVFNASGAASVNPNAVVPLASLAPSVKGNVTVDGDVLGVPTLVRTGTGSITIAAANDFALLDQNFPGAIYTAGYVADNASGFTAPVLPSVTPTGYVTKPVWATGGGNITVTAGRDIVGIETPVDATGAFGNVIGNYANVSSVGVSTGQFWSAWYYVAGKSTGSAVAPFDPSAGGQQNASWINYGTFFQGFGALGGGNITLEAGRNVKDVSASLPETIQVSGGQSTNGPAAVAHYYGGGNLLVEAGNDVLSGVYYVGRGTGLIRAGGAVAADATLYQTKFSNGIPTISDSYFGTKTLFSVPLLLAVQDSSIAVQATGAVTLGGIFEPTRIYSEFQRSNGNTITNLSDIPAGTGSSFDSYGTQAGISLASSTGSVTLQPLDNATLFTHYDSRNVAIGGTGGAPGTMPPNLSVTAGGDISLLAALYPSPTGELSLVAGGSIYTNGISMSDPVNKDGTTSFAPLLGSPLAALTAPLHAGDDVPVVIYAGQDIYGGTYTLLKQARLWAGRDIINVTFTGENNSDADITSIIAGRDILASRSPEKLGLITALNTSTFTINGPGNFVVQAGRDLGPFNTYNGSGGGILAVGNSGKPYLPLQGADITLRYGVSAGIDYAAAIATYGDAATATASGIDFLSGIIPELDKLLEQLIIARAQSAGIQNPNVTVALTPSDAADVFTALPTLAINQKLSELAAKAGISGLTFNLTPSQFLGLAQQQEAMKLTIDRGFLKLLAQVSLDYNDPKSAYSGQYKRAYQAIATLFPASLGYTDNSGGGSGVAPVLKHTGDLRMARSLVETQTGGDINILGPGGNAFVGSNAADTLLPSQQGILTLQGGTVRTYTDVSALIYQSRIFTEQGGNVEMFSANGDLNAGKGPKSSAAYPPLLLICDVDGYCRVNPAGLVTGAGVGALISVPGQDPAKSNVILSAPRGIIDFGAAGVRTAGNLNVVAQLVLNAFNVEVGGTAVGVPTFQAPDVGGLTQASSAGSAAVKDSAAAPAQRANEQPSIIIVEVIGYGGGDGNPEASPEDKRKRRKDDQQSP